MEKKRKERKGQRERNAILDLEQCKAIHSKLKVPGEVFGCYFFHFFFQRLLCFCLPTKMSFKLVLTLLRSSWGSFSASFFVSAFARNINKCFVQSVLPTIRHLSQIGMKLFRLTPFLGKYSSYYTKIPIVAMSNLNCLKSQT